MKPNDAVISGSLLAGGTNKVPARRRSCVAFAGVMSSLLVLAAAPDYAADPSVDIKTFVDCINKISATSTNPVADAVACLPAPSPAGCYTTVTMSEESAQPGCKLRDGTQLPRVIFSCPGTGGSTTFRFRPSFTLCTQSDVFKHIEVGEDVNKSTRTDDPALKNFPYLQKMADIDTSSPKPFNPLSYKESAVLDAKSPGTSKGCAECHDRMGTLNVAGVSANLFLPIPAAAAEGTIYTDDPALDPVSTTTLSEICTGINGSSQLQKSGKKALVLGLCNALSGKIRP
jgi:hypothetical protein